MAKKKQVTLESFEEKVEPLVVEEEIDDIVVIASEAINKIYQIKTIERWKLNNAVDLVSQGRNDEAVKLLMQIQTIDRNLLSEIINLLNK